jgi:hypothetical protein
MDTDELSEMAYDIIVQAAQISDTLKAELGTLSGNYNKEDNWLQGVLGHLKKISADPDAYVEYWNLETEEGVTPTVIKETAAELSRRANKVMSTALNRRGKIEW